MTDQDKPQRESKHAMINNRLNELSYSVDKLTDLTNRIENDNPGIVNVMDKVDATMKEITLFKILESTPDVLTVIRERLELEIGRLNDLLF